MGLVRMAARTAVVAGTATAVSGRVARRQIGPWKPSHLLDATLTDCCRDLAIRAHIRFRPHTRSRPNRMSHFSLVGRESDLRSS